MPPSVGARLLTCLILWVSFGAADAHVGVLLHDRTLGSATIQVRRPLAAPPVVEVPSEGLGPSFFEEHLDLGLGHRLVDELKHQVHIESVYAVWRRQSSWLCIALSFLLGASICCSGALRAVLGDSVAVFSSWCVPMSMVLWLFCTGLFQKWWAGARLGLCCQFLCWAALFLLGIACVVVCAFCCCMGLFVTAKLVTPLALAAIQNQAAKELRERFDKKESSLSGPRRMYYQSQAFKEKCDRIFEKAYRDTCGSEGGPEKTPEKQPSVDDQRGDTLRLRDLYGATHEAFGGDIPEEYLEIFQMAFDNNADSEIDQVEYMEMCKFFSVSCLPDEFRNRTISQHFETLSLGEDASLSDVKKQYRRLARDYHPDKCTDASNEADMQEINDAYESLRKHFEAAQGGRDTWESVLS